MGYADSELEFDIVQLSIYFEGEATYPTPLNLWHKPVNHFYKLMLQLKTEFMGRRLIYTQLYFVKKPLA